MLLTREEGSSPSSLGIAHASSVPKWWPRDVYYGWAMVTTLGFTAMASYGALTYAFAAFVKPIGADLHWSSPRVTGAFSVAQLVAGVSAIPVGHWVDRHGTRGLMTVGSILAAISLAGWSTVHSVAAYYAFSVLLGISMAAVLYEPTFAVVATWFHRDRSRALTLLTFLGGFASVIFVPLTVVLIGRFGWRGALIALAAIYAALTVVPHWFVLRRRPGDLGLEVDGHARSERDGNAASPTTAATRRVLAPNVTVDVAIRSRAFRWLAVAFSLSALASTAVTVHLVALLTERGYSARYAAGAMGLVGLMALPGRLVFTPLGEHWPRSAVTAAIFVMQAVAGVALVATRSALGVWVFVILFGAGFGAITPARAGLMADLFGAAEYGRIAGVMALILSLARTVAPVGASLLYVAGGGSTHGYDSVLVVLIALGVASAIAVRVADRGDVRARLSTVEASG